MTRVFFCHASEDKPVVEQVYVRVTENFPDVRGWLDTYEIVGGDDLIDKIAEGIEDADKFFVFLSQRSIGKPWVKAELRKALMAEIEGIKPNFIVPVKLGPVDKFPPFIESKYYIDLETKTEEEWLAEVYAAITGTLSVTGPDLATNLTVRVERAVDDPDVVAVVFEAQYWAEQVAFRVETTELIHERQHRLIPPQRGGTLNYAVQERERSYAVALPDVRLTPGRQFAMLMKFGSGADLSSVIQSVDRWDGSDSTQSGIAFLS